MGFLGERLDGRGLDSAENQTGPFEVGSKKGRSGRGGVALFLLFEPVVDVGFTEASDCVAWAGCVA